MQSLQFNMAKFEGIDSNNSLSSWQSFTSKSSILSNSLSFIHPSEGFYKRDPVQNMTSTKSTSVFLSLVAGFLSGLCRSNKKSKKGAGAKDYVFQLLAVIRALQALPGALKAAEQGTFLISKESEDSVIVVVDFSKEIEENWKRCHFKHCEGLLIAYHKKQAYYFDAELKLWKLADESSCFEFERNSFEITPETAKELLLKLQG